MLTLLGEGHQQVWRETAHAHTAIAAAPGHGRQSLLTSAHHADSFFFFFPDRPIERVYFLPNVRIGTHF